MSSPPLPPPLVSLLLTACIASSTPPPPLTVLPATRPPHGDIVADIADITTTVLDLIAILGAGVMAGLSSYLPRPISDVA